MKLIAAGALFTLVSAVLLAQALSARTDPASAARFVAYVQRRLFRPALQPAHKNQRFERKLDEPGLGLSASNLAAATSVVPFAQLRCWSNGVLYFTCPITPGPLTRAPVARSGTTPGNPRAASHR